MSAMPFTAKRPGGQGIDWTYLQTGISGVFLGLNLENLLLVLGTGHSYCIFNLVCQINAECLKFSRVFFGS